MEHVIGKAVQSIMKKYEKLSPHDFCVKDELGGVHDEGLGWNPQGVFCGECSNMTCVGCVNKGAKE
jgi:hypothetical protein